MALGNNTTYYGCVTFAVKHETVWTALEAHGYLFGSLFLILVFTASFTLITFIRNQTRSNPFIITINILVIIFGLMRASYLYIDPYGLKGSYYELGALLFADLAMPCLTSTFAIVQWVFLELTRMKLINRALQKKRVLVSVVVCHFVFIAALDFILVYVGKEACFLNTVCQAVTVLWGLVLTFGFLYSTQKLIKTERFIGISLNKVPRKRKKESLTKVKNTGIATTIVGVGMFSVSLYGMIWVYNASVNTMLGGEWGWYIFQTLQRILELCFGFIMVYLSIPRNSARKRKSTIPIPTISIHARRLELRLKRVEEGCSLDNSSRQEEQVTVDSNI